MFERTKQYLAIVLRRIVKGNVLVIVIPLILVFASLLVRTSTGGTHLIYSALGDRGLFPSSTIYSFLFTVRIVIFGVISGHVLTINKITCSSFKTIWMLTLSAVLLILEYKMIFGGVSLVLSIVFSIAIPVLVFFSIKSLFTYNSHIAILCFVFFVLQIILFVQLISLSICI